ncbi:hypothetical protein ACQYWQ_20145 [Streptomyces sp. P6-2-1]|uniref:hypothetical protein n=1 Tax=Streptomyces sp. P6-2-1 TaxID=3422591 RepID=UPI003D360CF4
MGSSRVTLCVTAALLAAVLGPQGAASAASGAPERPAVRAEACLARPGTPDAGFFPTPSPSRSCPPRDTNGPPPPGAARQAHAPEPAERRAGERPAAVPAARAAGPSAAQAVVGFLLAATAALVVAFGVLRRGRR